MLFNIPNYKIGTSKNHQIQRENLLTLDIRYDTKHAVQAVNIDNPYYLIVSYKLIISSSSAKNFTKNFGIQ
jgi:hypothetical protein